MVHAMEEMHPLGVPVQHLRGDAQRIAEPHFPVVGQMCFEGEHHAAPTGDIGRIATQLAAQRLGRLIEGVQIVRDVHVPVVVDPLRQDPGAMPVQRSGQVGRRNNIIHTLV